MVIVPLGDHSNVEILEQESIEELWQMTERSGD